MFIQFLLARCLLHVDHCIEKQLNLVLQHVHLQQLEARWRSLALLCDAARGDVLVKIRCLNIQHEALISDFSRHTVDTSNLFKKIYDTGIGIAGGEAFNILVLDEYKPLPNTCLAALQSIMKRSHTLLFLPLMSDSELHWANTKRFNIRALYGQTPCAPLTFHEASSPPQTMEAYQQVRTCIMSFQKQGWFVDAMLPVNVSKYLSGFRICHYLKALLREKQGRLCLPDELVNYIYDWLLNYCHEGSAHASSLFESVRVDLEEEEGLQVKLHVALVLKPKSTALHFQFDLLE